MKDARRESRSPHVARTAWVRGPKRAFDFLVALAVLIVTSPVLLLAMALVKLSSSGPVFYRQVRSGRDEQPFYPLKLRTMSANRVHDPNELVGLDHPEMTMVGRVLRRLKIDELPQILNVLVGDMSLIGPRPTLPEQTREYSDFQRRRLLARPGLTGLAQVNGNAAISWDERIRYDVYYVKHCSLGLDVQILFKTIMVVFLGEARFARPFSESPYARQRSEVAAR